MAIICCSSCSKRQHILKYIESHPHAEPEDLDKYDAAKLVIQQIKRILITKLQEKADNIEVYILPFDHFIVTSAPPNKLIISRAFFSKNSPYAADNRGTVTGAIAHEMCHLLFEHTNTNASWIKNNRNIYITKYTAKTIEIAGALAKINVDLQSFTNVYILDETYSDWYTESAADLFALQQLSFLGLDPNDYLQYYIRIFNGIDPDDTKLNKLRHATDQRIERIWGYFKQILPDEIHHEKVYLTTTAQGYRPNFLLFSDYGALFSSLNYNFNGSISGPCIQILRNVNFWKAAVRQNPSWCGKSSTIDEPRYYGVNIHHFSTTEAYLPYRVNGMPSHIKNTIDECTIKLINQHDAY